MLTFALALLFTLAAIASLIVLIDASVRGRNAYRLLKQMQRSAFPRMAVVTPLAPYRAAASHHHGSASVRYPAPLRAAA